MKEYIGDGVYAEYDGWSIILTTEDGTSVSNRIHLDPQTYKALVEWVIRLREKHSE